jgi:hypothetical protein
MARRMDLNEKTNISLFAVLSAVPFIVGAIIYISGVDAKATYAKERIDSMIELLSDIRERVVRIETKLNQTKRELR